MQHRQRNPQRAARATWERLPRQRGAHVTRAVRVLPRPLELERRDGVGEAVHAAKHFPGAAPGRLARAVAQRAVVLPQTPPRVVGKTDVGGVRERRVQRAQRIATVES